MTRHKDSDWNLPEELNNYEQAQLAVLMDIRDELKELNHKRSYTHFLEPLMKIVLRIDRRLAKKDKLR